MASSEEETEANEVVETSVRLFPLFVLLQHSMCACVNRMDFFVFLPNYPSSTIFVLIKCSQEPEESLQQVGRKRAAPRGRGRGRGSTAKRGRKTDIASIQSMMMSKDDDSDDEPPKKAPTRVSESYYCSNSSYLVKFGDMLHLIVVII